METALGERQPLYAQTLADGSVIDITKYRSESAYHAGCEIIEQIKKIILNIRLARLAPLVPFVLPAMGLVLRTPLGGVLDSAIGALPEGPDEASRRAAEFTIVAVAHGEDGSTGSGVVRGSDVYGLTAVIAVHGAAHMAAEGYDLVIGADGSVGSYHTTNKMPTAWVTADGDIQATMKSLK